MGSSDVPPRLHCQSFIFDPRPKFPYLIAVNRYWVPELCSTDVDAITLILAHGNGAHKEQWEPTLEHLFEHLTTSSRNGIKVREAWCIDAPNHGDSAILNDHFLERSITWATSPCFQWEDYSRSLHLFLAGRGTGVDVDFGSRKLVGIGHSLGAVAVLLTTSYIPDVMFHSVILVDPAILRRPRADEPDMNLADYLAKKRDIWSSREEAMQFFRSTKPHKTWNERNLEIYVNHGLRELPTAMYPDVTNGVTLKCPRAQESALYRERQTVVRAYDYLSFACKSIPVHFIYGGMRDYFSKALQDDTLQVAAQGLYATVAEVDGAGHLIPQMQPKGLAAKIWDVIMYDVSRLPVASGTHAKL